MSAQRDRDEFIAIATQEGLPLDVARILMRHAKTLHRIAELQCSSEAADRDRVHCPGPDFIAPGRSPDCLCRDYGSYDDERKQHGTVPRINVQERRLERLVMRALKPYNVEPVFNGDPRGPALLLKVPSGRTNDWGRRGVCVP
jgi:hypothetical protein